VEKFKGLAGIYLAQPGDTAVTVLYVVDEVLYQGRSKYQEIAVVKLRQFGKALVLDGLIQSTEVDEYIYHEALVHPAMVAHPQPKRVLILGGGEGATLREVLKHNTVEEAVMVDIDEQVVEVAKKYLQEWHQGAFNDPRSRIVIADGLEYVKDAVRRNEVFDVVIMDLTDPYGSEIAHRLYGRQAFEMIKSILARDGIVVTQAGSSYFFSKAYDVVVNSVSTVFSEVCEYGVWVPSFLYINNFIAASDVLNPCKLSAEYVDSTLRKRGVATRMYNGRAHVSMMLMPILRPGGRS
jgi:spermidine synthase